MNTLSSLRVTHRKDIMISVCAYIVVKLNSKGIAEIEKSEIKKRLSKNILWKFKLYDIFV